MANKKILAIDIDDEKFKAFYEQFKEFHGDLDELPEAWKDLGEAATQSHEAIAAAAGVLIDNLAHASSHAKDLVDHLKEASDAQKDFKSASTGSEITLKKMGKEAKEFAKTIFGIGKFLMKLGVLGVGTVAGGLFGFDKLAEGAVGAQRQARGLGLTTGQLRAFQTDLGARYIDKSTLGSIADARNDLTKQWALRRATGLSQGELDQTDVGTLAAQLALRAHDWWSSTPANQHNAQFLQTTGLTQAGLSLDQVRQFGNTDRAELTRALAQYQHDSKSLNVSDHNTDALYAFMRDLKLAGSDIETYFSNKLAVLGPHLGDFITTLETDGKKLLDEVLAPANLQKAEDAIDSFTKYLESDDFKKNIIGLGEDLKHLGEGVEALAKFIAYLLPEQYKLPDQQDDQNNKNIPDPENIGANSRIWHPYNFVTHGSTLGFPNVSNQYLGPGYENINPDNPAAQKNLALFKSLETQYALPSGVIGGLAYDESKGNPHAMSSTGAMGLMQLLKGTARDMGVTDPWDFNQSAEGGAKYLSGLYKKYGGNSDEALEKAIAAYHDGPAAFDRETKGAGKDWMSHVSMEGQGEILTVMKQLAKYRQAQVNITVTSKIGADVAVQTNAGAAG